MKQHRVNKIKLNCPSKIFDDFGFCKMLHLFSIVEYICQNCLPLVLFIRGERVILLPQCNRSFSRIINNTEGFAKFKRVVEGFILFPVFRICFL